MKKSRFLTIVFMTALLGHPVISLLQLLLSNICVVKRYNLNIHWRCLTDPGWWDHDPRRHANYFFILNTGLAWSGDCVGRIYDEIDSAPTMDELSQIRQPADNVGLATEPNRKLDLLWRHHAYSVREIH